MTYLKNRKVLLYLTCYTVLILLSGIFIGKHLSHKDKYRPHRQSYSMMEKFTKKLNLSADQQQKLSIILDTHKKSIKDKRKDIKDSFRLLNKQRIQDITLILTPEQVDIFKKMQEKKSRKKTKNTYKSKRK